MSKKMKVLGLAFLGMLCMVSGIRAQQKITPQPQPGSDGSIQTFMSDHASLTNLRKNNSALFNAEKVNRRTREYAKEYGVNLTALEYLKPLPAKKGAAFREVPVRTVTQGDFHAVMTHFNRMHIFMMIQNPVRLEMVADDSATAVPGSVKLTWENLYSAVADPAEYFRYGRPGEVKTNYTIGEIEAREDEKVDTMRLKVNDLGKTQENGLLSRMMFDSLDALSTLHPTPHLAKILWTPTKGMELHLAGDAKPEVLEGFRQSIAGRGYYTDVTVAQSKSGAGKPIVLSFKHNPQPWEQKIPFPNRGSLQFPDAYSPLGKINPFLHDPKAANRFVSASENDLLKQMTVFDYRVTKAKPGFLGFGREAEISLPNDRTVQVDLGSVITRYNGKVVEIEANEIVVEEHFSNAFGEVQKKRSAIRSNPPVSTSVDS